MCGAAGVSLGLSGAGALLGAVSAYEQGKANERAYGQQAEISRKNAAYAEMQAKDALDRGHENERRFRRQVRGFKGSQRARLAASGVSLDEGSALNILTDTDYLGNEDALLIRENAQREAAGHKHQAEVYRLGAQMYADRAAAENPTRDAIGALIGGGGQVAGQWYTGKAVGAF